MPLLNNKLISIDIYLNFLNTYFFILKTFNYFKNFGFGNIAPLTRALLLVTTYNPSERQRTFIGFSILQVRHATMKLVLQYFLGTSS